MILGFKHKFVPKILEGTKIHTFRKGNRWKTGNSIQMATGVRSKMYNQFNTDRPDLQECKSVQDASILIMLNETAIENKICITIDNHVLLPQVNYLFAYNDGFESLAEFYDWFAEAGEEVSPGIIQNKGQIIHWTDFKY